MYLCEIIRIRLPESRYGRFGIWSLPFSPPRHLPDRLPPVPPCLLGELDRSNCQTALPPLLLAPPTPVVPVLAAVTFANVVDAVVVVVVALAGAVAASLSWSLPLLLPSPLPLPMPLCSLCCSYSCSLLCALRSLRSKLASLLSSRTANNTHLSSPCFLTTALLRIWSVQRDIPKTGGRAASKGGNQAGGKARGLAVDSV